MQWPLRALPLSLLLLSPCCARSPDLRASPRGGPEAAAAAPAAALASDAAPEDAGASDAAPEAAAPSQLDPDGDDDPQDLGAGAIPPRLRFERVGRPPLALQRICDLTPLGDALYAAHANLPLGTDGATITRYRPGDPKPFAVAFDWNRPGEPTTGGGGGQGFLRVHATGGRLLVPDADPPYAGFGIADRGTEGYVFVSDDAGVFAPARQPGHRPPPTAAVLPRAYHVIDAIRFRGRLFAATGSAPPTESAWGDFAPGALHAEGDAGARWPFEVGYPPPLPGAKPKWIRGVWRLTFMVRFRDRLYAGIQAFDPREPNDYVVFEPGETLRAFRATRGGGAQTLRWYADRGSLYWIAFSAGEGVRLRVTPDGSSWEDVALPPDAGRPTDITRYRDGLVVLTERGLYRLPESGGGAVTRLADVDADRDGGPPSKSPFELTNGMCASPLAVFQDTLYAGGQRDGALYRLVP